MTAARRAAGVAVALIATFGLAAASGLPLAVHPSSDARLRVAFSARPARVERCRTRSAEELADVPAHMRQGIVCEGTAARYRLSIRRDGAELARAVVRGGGLRHDRQLYVLRELPLPAGASTIEVTLERIDAQESGRDSTGSATMRDAQRDLEERRRREADEVPAALALRETVTLGPREVLLVTYDQEARRLRAVRGTP